MKKFMINLLLLFTITVFSLFYTSCAVAGTTDPNVSDSEYIKYGNGFDYIHELCGVANDGSFFCGSCVSIDAQWILTAAHVVEDVKLCSVSHNGTSILIKDIILHPKFSSNNFGCADIALCYLSEELTLKFYPELYEDNDEENQLCSMSGYGFTGTFNSGMTKYDGKRRAGSNFVDKIFKDLLICSNHKNTRKTSLEFLICSGDSGGGLFIGNKLAGIHSCIFSGADNKANGNYGDESGHTRVSSFVDWIRANIKKKNP